MELELFYEDSTKIPVGFEKLYTITDGKATLTGVNGMKTQGDIDRVQEGLRKEREEHSKTKDLLKPFKGMDAAETRATLDRIAELEAANGGKLDDEAINKIVESRIAQKTAPLQRQIDDLTTTNTDLTKANEGLTGTISTGSRNEAVRKIAAEMKVHGTAIADVELVAANYLEKDEHTGNWIVKSDAQGVTPGTDVKQFMKEMQKIRPHWWPASTGGGAGGGLDGVNGGKNPFSGDGWNITEQGALLRSDRALATQLATAAGTSIGGDRPAATQNK
tara:strand:+ start:5992 stop:6819 length:828 start_codon:yes stop_codon:yes gene_type:complete